MKRLALFAALTCVMTWPQLLVLGTQAAPHHDVYFNMWRLAWFAHAAVSPSAAIFDANIFHPELRTLALSDAIFVEGVFAAPMIWLGFKPVLVHNLTLLAGITLSGVAMYALVKYLTGSRGAGVIAGMVFAYAPFRFEHFMHMEMQWAMWSPLAFLSLHRLWNSGRMRDGLALGASIALQMLSSIYYGIFLATLIGLATVMLLIGEKTMSLRKTIAALAAGALLAAVVCGVYARPYLEVRRTVGDRSTGDIRTFGASTVDYLAATPNNWLYGREGGRAERHLFPGATPVLLAMVALLLRVPGRRIALYLLLLAAAFEMSLGPRGYSYPFLYDHVSIYRALRATARLGIFVLLFLGVLAGYGYQALVSERTRAVRLSLLGACVAALLIEYHVTLALTPYPNTAPGVYRMLAAQPRGIVAEFPVPRADALPGDDAEYTYMSIFHWFPLVNGYSGNYPGSYLNRLDRLREFPDARSVHQLRRDGVRYIVLHEGNQEPGEVDAVRVKMQLNGAFDELGSFRDASGPAWLYRLRY